MDITAYLDRINYHGPLAPTAETLRELQSDFAAVAFYARAHLLESDAGWSSDGRRDAPDHKQERRTGGASANGRRRECGDVARSLRHHPNLTLPLLRPARSAVLKRDSALYIFQCHYRIRTSKMAPTLSFLWRRPQAGGATRRIKSSLND